MKKNYLFLIGISIGILCYACTAGANENEEENSPYGPPVFSKSYIQWFIGDDRVEAIVRVGGFKVDEDTKIIDEGYLGIDPDGRYSSLSDTIRLLIIIDGNGFSDCARNGYYPSDLCLEHTRKFLAQIAEIGDTTFNRKVYGFGAAATLAQIKSVTITGDKDFGANYPAGSSLNELFTIYFNDPYALIKNNYQPIADTYKYFTDSYTSNYPYAVFKENLSAVNFAERPFIDFEWHLVLNVAPETTDTYTFHVAVTLADDTVLETSASLGIQGTNDAL
jgi:hypothetical protein